MTGDPRRGAGRDRLVCWSVFALAAAVWLVARWQLPWVLWAGDEREYADIARQLVRGDGFTTRIVYPALVDYGVAPAQPSLVRPPLWPLAIAATFLPAGSSDAATLVALLPFYLGTVVAAAGIARRLGGGLAGVAAGVATALSPPVLLYALVAGTEMMFTFWVTLVFLLLAAGGGGVWVGVACGLAYLTRYNSLVVVPAALVLLTRPAPLRELVRCAAGGVVVVLPWLVRNWRLTGDPFYTLLAWNLYFNPAVMTQAATLYHVLRPGPGSPAWADPWGKFRLQLPVLLRAFPLASANPIACVGVLLGAFRGELLSIAFLLLAVGTTLSIAFMLVLGRYFVPLVPVLAALGAAGWARGGGWLRVPGLLALVLVPLVLPPVPAEIGDLIVSRGFLAAARRDPAWAATVARARRAGWDVCLAGRRPLVVAEDASIPGWYEDTPAIWLAADARDLGEVLSRFPVEFVEIESRKDLVTPTFAAAFAPRPDCGASFYQRRPTADAPAAGR